jgi:hypothetical protein
MKKTAVFLCVLLVSSMMLTSAAVTAKKPDNPGGGGGGGGGSSATGRIYYHMYDDNNDLYIYSIDPDGTDKVRETLIGTGVQSMSWEKHNEHYWYVGLVSITDETYPDGEPRHEIYAIRDDNTMGFQMTDDENMAFPTTNWGGQPMWVPGDDMISWVASYWTPVEGGSPTQGGFGVYEAEVEYDDDGNVAGLGDPSFAYDAGYFHYTTQTESLYYPDVRAYDWSPDLGKIAFLRTEGYIYIDSVPASGSPTQLVQGYSPKWSPDGAMIAFSRHHELNVINTDGSGEENLVTVKSTKGVTDVWGYHWSPDSKYLVYTIWERNLHNWATKTTIYTIKPDGSSNSAISGLSINVWKYSRGWREV